MPPLSPAPAATLVTVPRLFASAVHVQATPVHFGIWLAAQARPPIVAAFAP